jgi:hypothetical protein
VIEPYTVTLERKTVWQVVAASRPGARHLAHGEPGEDALRWERSLDGLLVAALADGAGSARMAVMSAMLAADAAIAPALRHLRRSDGRLESLQDAARAGMYGAYRAIRLSARHFGFNVSEYMTTLIVVVANANGAGAAQVGDGAVVVRDAAGRTAILTSPQRGELVNETECLSSEHALSVAQFVRSAGPVTHVAAFTDGLQRLALRFADESPHAGFFDPLFDSLDGSVSEEVLTEDLEVFLQSQRVQSRTDDDVTLLLATLLEPQ